MLNIFKNKSSSHYKKQENIKFLEKKGEYIAATRHYAPANKEWLNSIYTYNKNSLKLLPIADGIIKEIITSYFNMYSKYLEKMNKARRLTVKQRRFSLSKNFISKPELKHTNDKVIINIYMYALREKLTTKKIKNLVSRKFFSNIRSNLRNRLIELTESEESRFEKSEKGSNRVINLYKDLLNYHEDRLEPIPHKLLRKIMKTLKKEIFVMHYIQSLFFNRLKATSLYMEPLKLILSKIYSKKVILNIVKLKSYFLNSDIFIQILTIKMKNRKNNIAKVLAYSLSRIKTPVFRKKFIVRESAKLINVQNTLINNNDKSHKILLNILDNNYKNSTRLDVLNSIKSKTVTGVRIEGSGRLSKRITAARSLTKIKYKGTLKNVDSSYRGLSSVILRGNTRSNTQYSFSSSKTRIGSFGLKGWISST